jgi:hypothetical protein
MRAGPQKGHSAYRLELLVCSDGVDARASAVGDSVVHVDKHVGHVACVRKLPRHRMP